MPQKHLVIPNGMNVELWWVAGGITMKNILFAQIPPSYQPSVANANAITAALNSLYNSSALAGNYSAGGTMAKAVLRDLRDIGFPLIESTTAGIPGTNPNELLPQQIAACLTLRTARAGRQFRGRMYVPGFTEGGNGPDNHMVAALKTALDAFATGLPNAINQGGIALSVCHRPLYGADGSITVPGSLQPVTQVVCRDNIWDTQRRRAH